MRLTIASTATALPAAALLLVLLLLLQGDNNGVAAQEVLDFRVTDYAKFTCEAKGFRCGYIKDDYGSFDIGEGSQDSIGAIDGQGNNVWSNVDDVDAALTLQDCQIDYCLVRCNFGCHCDQENGDACADATVPPTEQQPTSPPEVCPLSINAEVCPLLIDAVPAGNIDNYDCFNFCNGTFVSSCEFDGTCADFDCGVDRASTDGMKDGIIVGCSKAALRGQDTGSGSGGGTASGSGSSNAVALGGKFSAFVLVAVASAWLFV